MLAQTKGDSKCKNLEEVETQLKFGQVKLEGIF